MNLGLWEDFKNKKQGNSIEKQTMIASNKNWDDSIRDKKGKIVNIKSYLNIRHTPGGKIIGKLYNGQEVTLWRLEGDWYHIYSPISNYHQAYVHKNYVQVLDNSVNKSNAICTPTSEFNVRSGPGTSYSKIGMVYPGGKLKISEQNGNWYKISYATYNGTTKRGWVSANYVKNI